jgi:hypothetical protein
MLNAQYKSQKRKLFVMQKKTILVFPCGSEVGLEIHRSLSFSTHFELVGASSADDHGRFIYKKYAGGLPFHNDPNFEDAITEVIKKYKIDCLYPAMDAVAVTLHRISKKLGLKIIGSSYEATKICASKKLTYAALDNLIPLPKVFNSLADTKKFPVFIKPDVGYGSRNTLCAKNSEMGTDFLNRFTTDSMLILEYLPGEEWTIDCFSDRNGNLLFHGARNRQRISNGISVRTTPSIKYEKEFSRWAKKIQSKIKLRGAWFFQAKINDEGHPRLLEVAARLGGSSALFRCKGVNFALLSAYDSFDYDVSIIPNCYAIELDRALSNRYKIDLQYTSIYTDLDDCLIIRDSLNLSLINLIYKAHAEKKTIKLITRHAGDLSETLKKYRIENLFDEIIHLKSNKEKKSDYICDKNSIFIDDSHTERLEVKKRLGISTFSPDMIECLL